MTEPTLETLLEYPNCFTFRLIAAATPDLGDRCVALAEAALSRPMEGVVLQPSSGGKWCSVRLTVTVETANEIRAVYAALQAVEGLRMLL